MNLETVLKEICEELGRSNCANDILLMYFSHHNYYH